MADAEVAIDSPVRNEQGMPRAWVHYPSHYGTFIAYADGPSDAPILCACAKQPVANYLTLRTLEGLGKYADPLVTAPLSCQHFPPALARASLSSAGVDPMSWLDFEDGLCHRCCGTIPTVAWCAPMYGSKLKQELGWFIQQERLRLGIGVHGLAYIASVCPPDLRALIAAQVAAGAERATLAEQGNGPTDQRQDLAARRKTLESEIGKRVRAIERFISDHFKTAMQSATSSQPRVHRRTSVRRATKVEPELPSLALHAPLSSDGGRLRFLRRDGQPCGLEEAAVDQLDEMGIGASWVGPSLWQSLFALALWDEIFAGATDHEGMPLPSQFNDVPSDVFTGETFYGTRKSSIDARLKELEGRPLHRTIQDSLSQHGGSWTRLLYPTSTNGDFTFRQVIESPQTAAFLERMPNRIFVDVLSRMAENYTVHRNGLPQVASWIGVDEFTFGFVRPGKGKLGASQIPWAKWTKERGHPAQILQVFGALAGASARREDPVDNPERRAR